MIHSRFFPSTRRTPITRHSDHATPWFARVKLAEKTNRDTHRPLETVGNGTRHVRRSAQRTTNYYQANAANEREQIAFFFQTDLRYGERLPRGRQHATRTRGCDRGHNHRGQQAPREEQRAQSARYEAQDTQMPVSRMQESLHQELASQGSSKDAHGWVRCKLRYSNWFEVDSYIESVDELADRYRCEIIRYSRSWHITRTEIIGVVELNYYYDELHAYSNEYCSPRGVYKHVSASCDKFFKPPHDTSAGTTGE